MHLSAVVDSATGSPHTARRTDTHEAYAGVSEIEEAMTPTDPTPQAAPQTVEEAEQELAYEQAAHREMSAEAAERTAELLRTEQELDAAASVMGRMNDNITTLKQEAADLRAALGVMQAGYCDAYCIKPREGEDFVHADECDIARAVLDGGKEKAANAASIVGQLVVPEDREGQFTDGGAIDQEPPGIVKWP